MENFLFDAIACLAKAGVDFVICGGVACILQGSNRNSFDLDISVDMNETNLKKLINVAKEKQWVPRVPEPIENILDPLKRKQWIKEKMARVFTLNSPDGLLQIDIFLTYPIGFEELKKGADIFAVEDIQFKVSSKQHLVKAKKLIENKRNQDMYDIQMLEELLHETGKR
jgi:hypothetical protein